MIKSMVLNHGEALYSINGMTPSEADVVINLHIKMQELICQLLILFQPLMPV